MSPLEEQGPENKAAWEATQRFTSRLFQGWGIGRALASHLATMNPLMRNLGPLLIVLTQSLNDLISSQKELNAVLIRTGRSNMLGSKQLISVLDRKGLSFTESVEVLSNAIMVGLTRDFKSTGKLLGEFKLLGIDMKKMSTSIAFNRHVLGVNSRETNELAKGLEESSASYKISTNAVVDAVNSLRDTMKSAAVTYGTAVPKALQEAMPLLMGRFGTEAAGEINKVAAALFSGGPKSAELAMRLGIPLEMLSGANTKEKIVTLFEQAVARMESIVGPARGMAGSEFLIPALVKAFGDVPELALLGRRLGDLREQGKITTHEALVANMNRDTFMVAFNDLKRSITVNLIPTATAMARSITTLVDSLAPLFPILSLLAQAFAVIGISQYLTTKGKAVGGAIARKSKSLGIGRAAAGKGAFPSGGVIGGSKIKGLVGGFAKRTLPGLIFMGALMLLPKLFGKHDEKEKKDQKRHDEVMDSNEERNNILRDPIKQQESKITGALMSNLMALQSIHRVLNETAATNADLLTNIIDKEGQAVLGIQNLANQPGFTLPTSTATPP